MTVPLEIDEARAEDAGELLTLQRAAYLSEGALHADFTIRPLTETLAEVCARVAGGGVLVARSGHRIVGTVQARVTGDTCHVGRIAVAPDLQGQGIGTGLLAEVERRYAGRVRRYELFTGPRSAPNLRLYRRLGYRDMPTPAAAEPGPAGGEPLVYLEKLTGS